MLTIRNLLIIVLTLLSFNITSAIAGDRVYQYTDPNGRVIFSDRKKHDAKLVKVKYYGRPAAKVSCVGDDSTKMASRMSTYQPFIDKYAKEYNIDPDLVIAVIRTESCFDRKAVSRVGARGLMQLMPATAKYLGVKDSFDAEQNIEGGVKYLREMLDTFNQDQKLALAAYNAGPGAVNKYNGIPPFKETQNYVKKITAMYSPTG